MSCCEFECDEFDNKFLYPMVADKEFSDSKFPLDVRTMKEYQYKDTNNQKLSKRRITNQYTIIQVEGVFLVHNNNRILVLEFMSDRVLQWYHLMQVHPSEKQSEIIICFVYT